MLAVAGQIPIVRSLLPIGHDLVAANRRLLFGPAGRIFWLKVTVTFVFCVGLAVSPHLWIGTRTYPPVPISSLLPASAHALEHLLFLALFALAAAILVCGEAAKAHRRVSRRHRRLLRPGSDPLAAVGVSICVPAGDARAVFAGHQRYGRAEADPEHRPLDRRRHVRLLRPAEAQPQFRQLRIPVAGG